LSRICPEFRHVKEGRNSCLSTASASTSSSAMIRSTTIARVQDGMHHLLIIKTNSVGLPLAASVDDEQVFFNAPLHP
jgi:hypothetical protein